MGALSHGTSRVSISECPHCIIVLFHNFASWWHVSCSMRRLFLSAKGVVCETRISYSQAGEVCNKWVG